MTKTQIVTKYEIILKRNLTDFHRKIFSELLIKQGKVKGDLTLKADRCKMICLVFKDNVPIAIGGIKKKTNFYFSINQANLPELQKEFTWELGYLFNDKKANGKGVASHLTKILIYANGKANLMASTEITTNPAMVKILKNNGFKQYGNHWQSGIHKNYLGLFLKFK